MLLWASWSALLLTGCANAASTTDSMAAAQPPSIHRSAAPMVRPPHPSADSGNYRPLPGKGAADGLHDQIDTLFAAYSSRALSLDGFMAAARGHIDAAAEAEPASGGGVGSATARRLQTTGSRDRDCHPPRNSVPPQPPPTLQHCTRSAVCVVSLTDSPTLQHCTRPHSGVRVVSTN